MFAERKVQFFHDSTDHWYKVTKRMNPKKLLRLVSIGVPVKLTTLYDIQMLNISKQKKIQMQGGCRAGDTVQETNKLETNNIQDRTEQCKEGGGLFTVITKERSGGDQEGLGLC